MTWVSMSEVGDVLTKGFRGVVTDRVVGAQGYVSAGKVDAQLLASPPGYLGFPDGMLAPFAFRPTGVTISLSAAVEGTGYVCCLPRDADFLRQSGDYVGAADFFVAGNGGVEEKFSGVSHTKWNDITQGFDEGDSPAVLGKHARAIVFTNNSVFRDLFGGPP